MKYTKYSKYVADLADEMSMEDLLNALSDYLLGPDPRYAALLDRGAVERLVRRQRDGDGRNVHLLLAILMLEVWLSSYLPRAVAAPEPARERVTLLQ